MEQQLQKTGMRSQSWQRWPMGVIGASIYCCAHLLLWRISFDQWYLPAGLRLACLMLLPMRQWPFIFLGDAAALLILRAPKAELYSVEWAYLSPLLATALISIAPFYLRSRLTNDSAIAKNLPLIAFVAGTWSSVVGIILNIVLSGPIHSATFKNFVSYSVGNYLGILMALLPCMLWRMRSNWKNNFSAIAQGTAIAVLMVSALFGAVFVVETHGNTVQLMPLVLMLLPVIYLTALHGWPGAAIGTFLISVAVSFALPRTNIAGAFDGVVLLAQIIISIVAAGLLTFGNYISLLFEKCAAAFAIFTELRSTRKSSLPDEPSDDFNNELRRDALCPTEIETYGLYAALMGPAFHDAWRQHARVYQNLSGDQHYLSITLRLAVYRAIFSAMESMQDYAPNEYDIRARVWRRRGRAGATVLITCSATREPEALSQNARDAFDELRARVFAFDGVLKRRHPCRIRFMMTEAIPTG